MHGKLLRLLVFLSRIKESIGVVLFMDIKEFVKLFAEQFDDTDESVFTPETVYQELEEWSSLTALTVIAFVRTNYGKKITAMNIRSCRTIQDLFELVKGL